ncbi:MAG: cell wall hydrolase [Lachnospiraceae bacterium]|nr:cell wall hydrolase [Lachnospiraceae bacterium]
MNQKKFLVSLLLLLGVFLCIPMQASAKADTELTPSADTVRTTKNGFITNSAGDTYYYVNNKKQKGFQKIDGKTYYFDNNGVMLTGFQEIKGYTYYFKSNGQRVTGLRKIGKYTYLFDKKGRMQTGFQTYNDATYYFNKKGRMQTGFQTIKKKVYYFEENGVMAIKWKTIDNKKYYFDKKGRMATGFQTISKKKYYFNEEGVMQKGLKKINKKYYYFSSQGVMQTGFVTIKNITYYFDENTGVRYTPKKDGTIKKIGNLYAAFNKDSSYQLTASYAIVKGVKVHPQYYTDPQVSTEKLLAAILYSEAGNQKAYPVKGKLNGKTVTLYEGHLGVGYVILNRMTSNLGIKEVIYQQYQFEPARTGVLTNYLNNYNLVSTDCKNAAKVLLYDLEHKTDSVADFKRSNFTWKNFWAVSYARTTSFFNVYRPEEYYIMEGHVFFNFTKSIP